MGCDVNVVKKRKKALLLTLRIKEKSENHFFHDYNTFINNTTVED